MFKDELRKALAWNTLAKRGGLARKILIADNPGFEEALRYPVPVSVPVMQLPAVEEEREDEVVDGEMEVDGPDMSPPEAPDTAMKDVGEPLTEKPTQHQPEVLAVVHQDVMTEKPSTAPVPLPLEQSPNPPAENASQQKLAPPTGIRRRIAAKAPRARPIAPLSEQPQQEQLHQQHPQQGQPRLEQAQKEQPPQEPGAYPPCRRLRPLHLAHRWPEVPSPPSNPRAHHLPLSLQRRCYPHAERPTVRRSRHPDRDLPLSLTHQPRRPQRTLRRPRALHGQDREHLHPARLTLSRHFPANTVPVEV
jgi:hypothetical protein